MKRLFSGLLLACACGAATAGAATAGAPPAFDPAALKGPAAGPPSELLVLATPHLAGIPATLQGTNLRLLIDRLAAWKPQAIAIEALSGPQCAFLRQYPQRYRETVQVFCWDPAPARAATGLDVPAATAAAERLLAEWPAAPTAAQRRRLAALFLAGGEPASALVQWLRLPAAERRAGDGLDAALVAILERLQVKRNEDTLIAAPLAAALGLERVVAMDDHTSDTPTPDEKAYEAAVTKAWDNPATAKRRQLDAAVQAKLATPEDVLALYRAYNAPDNGRLVFDSDFGAALEEPSPQHFGRNYVGYWEVRNLRMASNIREAMAVYPGKRMLVIVGASHKWYLEAYLNQMHDVRIVDVGPLLR
jgi:hypothetical protein